MNENPMDVLRQWALQTVTFALTVENAAKTGISQQVVEQTAVPASRISNQFFAESEAACATDPERVDRMFPELVNRVLDWVVERRSKSAAS
jgi:phage terminase Nu1 subunit (DNA packaging protein)